MTEGSESAKLLSTAAAARALGIDRSTLARWAMTRAVTPAQRTVGGHMRWDLGKLRGELEKQGAISPESD